MNSIKVEKRSSLGSNSLNDLLCLNADKVELSERTDQAIDLWWQEKIRRPNEHARDNSTRTTPNADDGDSEDNEAMGEDNVLLEDWEEWMET